jgi:hypothetical protein
MIKTSSLASPQTPLSPFQAVRPACFALALAFALLSPAAPRAHAETLQTNWVGGMASSDPIVKLYASGAWTEVASQGEAAGDYLSLTMAARALIAGCLTQESLTCRADAEKAEALARKAIRLGGDAAVEARLQLASALGVRTRIMGGFNAVQAGLPQEALSLAKEAQALAPDLPWADAFLGVWHVEAVSTAGAMAGLIGADLNKGLKAIDRALAASTGDPTLGAQVALALISADPRKHRVRIDRALTLALGCESADAFSLVMIERAKALRVLIDKGEFKAAQAFAKQTATVP